MNNLIRYVISPIIFLVIYTLTEYLISGQVDLKIALFSTVIYAILNAVLHILFDKKLKK